MYGQQTFDFIKVKYLTKHTVWPILCNNYAYPGNQKEQCNYELEICITMSVINDNNKCSTSNHIYQTLFLFFDSGLIHFARGFKSKCALP